ncbi:hypothetical protein SLS58_010963 [Diplodia intermedia]|uniref:Protein PBN1 n=1 Tax=Diplodia intermedia TaxID=856260 RepID=A0ABR3T339_9PEZI
MTYTQDEPIQLSFYPNANLSIATDVGKLSQDDTESYLGADKADLLFSAAAFAPYAPLHLIEVKSLESNDTDVNDPVDALGGLTEALRIAQRDLWDDIRIPYLEYLSGYDAQNPYAWVNVSDDELPVYESLVGMKITGLNNSQIGNTTVQVEASYPTLNCSEWIDLTAWLATHRAELRWLANTTDEPSMFESNGRHSSVFLDVHSPPSAPNPRLAIGYSGEANTTTTNNLINLCDVHTTHLDLTITCLGSLETGASTCAAQRARHSALYPLTGPETLDAVFHHTPLHNIPALLTTTSSPSSSTRFAHLLTNLGLPPTSTAYRPNTPLPSLPAPLLNARLAYFLNTYWRLALPGSAGRSKYASPSTAGNNAYWAPAPNATATVLLVDVYAVRWAWLGLYMAAAGTMLGCAVGAAALRAGGAGCEAV